MISIVLSLLAVAPVLEPDPQGLTRVQPREVEDAAALWAVDDDPATAWKPALDGARMRWFGGSSGTKTMKLFIRSGCQESQDAFEAFARPRHVSISPIRYRTQRLREAPSSKSPTTVELKDVAGWQVVDLPLTPGFTLKVKDTYPGNAHAEPCISDLRVYLDANIDPAQEQLAFEQVKQQIAERLTGAAEAPKRLPLAFVEAGGNEHPAPKAELSLQSADSATGIVKRARAAVSALRAVQRQPIAKLEERGWQRVSLDFVMRDDGTLEQVLRGREILGFGDRLLCSDDFKLAPVESNPLAGWKEKVKALQKLADRPVECRAACLPLYAPTAVSALGSRSDCERLCNSPKYDEEAKLDVAGSGIFVKGGLEQPEQVLVISSRERGEREVYRHDDRQLLVYENGRVVTSAVIPYEPKYAEARVLRWSDDSTRVTGYAHLTFEGTKVEGTTRYEARDEHAALTGDSEATLAFELQR